MNYLGHHEVARQLSDNPENRGYFFGAMAPDFVGMFRVKKNPAASSPEVQEGMDLHQVTDTVFDALGVVTEIQSAMGDDFKLFMPKWTAVQCARAGIDMLFDGIHVNNPEAMASYRKTMAVAAAGGIAVATVASPPDLFLERLQDLEEHGPPNYSDPHVVAQRLHARLQGMRSAFDINLTGELAEALSIHQSDVFEVGNTVIEEVMNRLSLG